MYFNGINRNYITVLRGRQREFFAPITNESKFSSHLVKQDRGHRTLIIPIWIKYKNMKELRGITEDMAKWLVHSEPKTLEFEDEPDRLYWAVVDDTINEETLYNQGTEATITFIAGYKYSHERTIDVNLTANEPIEGHKSTTWKSRTTFTSNQSVFELEFKQEGKEKLRDITKIRLKYNFVEGDIMEIDYSKRKVTVNGEDISNTIVILKSNFAELPIGKVDFEASHKTDVIYSERYY